MKCLESGSKFQCGFGSASWMETGLESIGSSWEVVDVGVAEVGAGVVPSERKISRKVLWPKRFVGCSKMVNLKEKTWCEILKHKHLQKIKLTHFRKWSPFQKLVLQKDMKTFLSNGFDFFAASDSECSILKLWKSKFWHGRHLEGNDFQWDNHHPWSRSNQNTDRDTTWILDGFRLHLWGVDQMELHFCCYIQSILQKTFQFQRGPRTIETWNSSPSLSYQKSSTCHHREIRWTMNAFPLFNRLLYWIWGGVLCKFTECKNLHLLWTRILQQRFGLLKNGRK